MSDKYTSFRKFNFVQGISLMGWYSEGREKASERWTLDGYSTREFGCGVLYICLKWQSFVRALMAIVGKFNGISFVALPSGMCNFIYVFRTAGSCN